MAQLSIRLFGPFEVQRDGRPLDEQAWRSRQNRTILQILLSRPGNAVTAGELLGILWPDANEHTARRRLHVRMRQLRRTLDPEQGVAHIETLVGGYAFSVKTECWIDTAAFESHAERGRRAQEEGDIGEAITAYETARTLYRGDFLEENTDDEWTFAERERLRERYQAILTELAECYALQGRYRRAVNMCHQILSADSSREAVHVRLMLYYYYAGERTEALRAYERCRAQLAEQLGVQPLPATSELVERIRDGSLWSLPDGPRYPPPAHEGRLFAVPYSLGAPPFVGRKREYAWLIERWQHMSPGVIAIAGEAGAGKSRLIQEFLGYAAEQGAPILRGRGRPGPALPYDPVTSALRDHIKPFDLSMIPAAMLSALAPLFPHLLESNAEAAPLPALPAAHEEERLLSAVSKLAKARHPAGAILFIDDAHYLDRPSVNLLLRLAESLTIVLAYRNEELDVGQQLPGALQPLRRKGLVAERQLESLRPEAVRRLIQRLAGRQLRPLADQIISRTQGNVLFVLAALQHLFEEGALYTDASGAWATTDAPSLSLPPSTQHALASRLNKLSRDQRQVFDLAAVVGDEFDSDLLRASSDLTEECLLDAIDALLGLGLLVEPGAFEQRELSLGHDIYGEAAYRTLPRLRLRRLHGKVARALLATTADSDVDAPALAQHFALAGEANQASEWSIQAGDGALARYAHEEALGYYRQALDLGAPERGPLLMQMGLVARHLARFEDAANYFGQALAYWQDLDDSQQQIRCHLALAECQRELSAFRRAVEHARQGIEMVSALGDRPQLAAQGHIILSNALRSGHLAPAAEVRRHLEQALELASLARAWQLVGEANIWLAALAINQGDTGLALTFDRRAIQQFQRSKQSGWLAIAHNNTAYHALLDGRPSLALDQAKQGLELARQIGSLHTQGWLLSTLGEVHLYLDQLEEAQIALEEGLALTNRWGAPRLKPGFLADLARASMARQAWDTAVAQLEAAHDLAHESAPQFLPRLDGYMAQAYLGRGMLVDAAEAADRALAMAESKSQHSVAGRAQRILGQIHTSAGRYELASQLFAASLDRLSRINDTLEVARTQAAWGNCLALMGDPAADALLRDARSVLEQAGALLYLRQMAESQAVLEVYDKNLAS